MTEFIFYTDEGFTQDPQGNDVENCQIMGRAFGDNQQDALCNLLAENLWIEDHGFDKNGFFCKELAPYSDSEDIITYLTELLSDQQLEEYTTWLKYRS